MAASLPYEHGHKGARARSRCNIADPPRTRAWNLRLRRPTPYPLGQQADAPTAMAHAMYAHGYKTAGEVRLTTLGLCWCPRLWFPARIHERRVHSIWRLQICLAHAQIGYHQISHVIHPFSSAREISTCGLVAMTSASHAEGRQFDPGQVYVCRAWATRNALTKGCLDLGGGGCRLWAHACAVLWRSTLLFPSVRVHVCRQ